MSKLSLQTIVSGYGTVDALNANFAAIQAAFDNTLSRDGTSPNAATADIDLNGHSLLNQGNPFVLASFNWRGSWVTATAYAVGDAIESGGSGYVCVVAHTSGTFATDLAAVKWQLFATAGIATPISLANGGLGASNANVAAARTTLGLGGMATQSVPNGMVKGDGTTVSAATAGSDYAKPNTESTWTAQQTPFNGTLTDAASISWDADVNGQVVAVTLGGNRTMAAPTNINQYAFYVVRVTQDGTGSRTLAWNAAFKFGAAGAPTLTTTASKTDFISFIGGAGNTLECLGVRLNAV